LFWLVFAVAVFIGAHAIGFVIHLLTIDNAPFMMARGPRLGINALAIPLLWIIAYGIFITVAHWFFRHTPKGYKWSLTQLLGLNLVLSIIIGAVLYVAGAPHSFDRNIMRTFAPKFGGDRFRERTWQRPEDGSLIGKVINIEDGNLTIKDPKGNDWNILFTELNGVKKGDKIGIHGEIIERQQFKADTLKVLPEKLRSQR